MTAKLYNIQPHGSAARGVFRDGLTALLLVCVFAVFFAMPVSPAFANKKYASLVMDARSGKVLHARNADIKLHPASLTKMMTLLLVFEALEAGKISKYDKIYISPRAANMVPSKLNLPAGSSIRAEDAIYALVTKSANDVAVALAEHLEGTEWGFSRRMTEKAQRIGMHNTHFQNASGLYHRYQRSTARDMAVLSRYLILNYPQYYRFFSTSSFRYQGNTYRNHNRLMNSYNGMDGLKTGYIAASGFNLAASAVRGETRLIGVVFGGRSTRSRDRHMASLLDSSFVRARQLLIAGADIPVPPPRPSFRGGTGDAVLLANASLGSKARDLPVPPDRKPANLVFLKSASLKLERHDNKSALSSRLRGQVGNTPALPARGADAVSDKGEAIPAEHLEMLARVLGSGGLTGVVGEGDYDPAVFDRIETGLLAVSAHQKMISGEEYSFADSLSEEALSSQLYSSPEDKGLFSLGKRVLTRLLNPFLYEEEKAFKSDRLQAQSALAGEKIRRTGAVVIPPSPAGRGRAAGLPHVSSEPWSVQIGAFHDRERTLSLLADVRKKFPVQLSAAQPEIVASGQGNKRLYRGRFTGMSRDEVKDLCRKLKDCLPLPPPQGARHSR